MSRFVSTIAVAALAVALGAGASAQAPPGPPTQQPFSVGNALGLPIAPAADGAFNPMSKNVKVFGAIYSAESCSYDPTRDLIVVPNRGVAQNVQTNNAWISFINHDGSVHTARWIGIQNPGEQRDNLNPKLVLNEPLGSDIVNGVLYLADRDGGTSPSDPVVSVVRKFNMKIGRADGRSACAEVERLQRPRRRERRHRLRHADRHRRRNAGSDHLAGVEDHAGRRGVDPRAGRAVAAAQRHRARPQGQHRGGQIGNDEVLTFTPTGMLVSTEKASQPGNDGLVIRPDGTKYVSSVVNGGVSRIRPGRPSELIAQNIPNPASMCYDAGGNQLVIPMNANNALAFIPLQ